MQLKHLSFIKVKDRGDWFVYGDGTGDAAMMEQEALALQSEALKAGFYCIAGVINQEGYGLYLVPRRGIDYVIREFNVGSHAEAEADAVIAEISAANAMNELIPYFADSAGLKAKFSQNITDPLIDVLEGSLYSVEAMMDEDEGPITGYIRKNQGIHLWWD